MKRQNFEEIINNHNQFVKDKRFNLLSHIGLDKEINEIEQSLVEAVEKHASIAKHSLLLTGVGVVALFIPSVVPLGIAFASLGGVLTAYNAGYIMAPDSFKRFFNKFTKKGRLENAKMTLIEEAHILDGIDTLYTQVLPESQNTVDALTCLAEKRLSVQESLDILNKSFESFKDLYNDEKFKNQAEQLGMKYAKCITFVENFEKQYIDKIADLEQPDTEQTKRYILQVRDQTPVEYRATVSKPKTKDNEQER